MKEEAMHANRREFLTASALAGYSLFINAERLLAADTEVAATPRFRDFVDIAPPQASPGQVPQEASMRLVDLGCDIFIAGGGMSGVCAALAAARHGARVVLVQDRSRLGGNASSEIKMHIVGADQHGSRSGWREGGLIEELRLEDAVHNAHRAWELWDLMLYDKCIREQNITLLLDSTLYAATVEAGQIREVRVRCDKTEHLYRIRAGLYCDCTGDSRLALEAGADMRMGREGTDEFGESLAQDQPDTRTQGSSILFTAREHDRPIPYQAPPWARKITREDLRFRGVSSWEYGYWWIELGGMLDTIRDNERLRFELLSVVLGVWDYIKNSGDQPSSANWALETVGMIPGKRESRRIMGDYMMTQVDLEGAWTRFDDGVAIGGWAMDDHPPEGFDAPDKRPYQSIKMDEPYNIALGALYSRNIHNLMMAGRNISCSHVAFSSTRVMATCSALGQAVGTAAAQCVQQGLLPRALRHDKEQLRRLQQTLLRDDQTIRKLRNTDAGDLARKAVVSASTSLHGTQPEWVINGVTRDRPKEWRNRWAGSLDEGPATLELTWDALQTIHQVQLTFDTGFHRELTLSASDSITKRIVRAPQPETVRDYILQVRDGSGRWTEVAKVEGNYQRLRRHDFKPVRARALRLRVSATNGAEEARLYEIRCYG
jgi:hypothetical protein